MSATRRGVLAGAGALAVSGCARADEVSFALPETFTRFSAPIAAPLRGVNVHNRDDGDSFAQAARAGFSFVRHDTFWERVELYGRFDFKELDAMYALLAAHGLGVLWVLDYGHPDHGGEAFDQPAHLAAFARFAEALARHFRGRNVAYEIWNEPDVEEKAFIPPQRFAALIAAGVQGLRKGDPQAVVASGGLSWVDWDYITPLTVAAAMNPAPVSAVGMHFYRADAPESALADMELVRTRMAPSFGNAPLWNTEWGYSSAELPGYRGRTNGLLRVHRQRQAVMLARQFLVTWRAGLQRSVWFELEDFVREAFSGDHNLGLLDADNRAKPALEAARTFAEVARGRTLVGAYSGLPRDVWGLRLAGEGAPVAALWCARQHMRADVTLPAGADARDMLGRPLRIPRGVLSFSEAAGPVYVTLG